MAGKIWLDSEIQFIKDNYMKMSCAEMATHLPGRTTKSVQHMYGGLCLDRNAVKIGDKFNALTVLEMFEVQEHGQKKTHARCRCDCGNEYTGLLTLIRRDIRKSCGCNWKANLRIAIAKHRESIDSHGKSKTRIYRIWSTAKSRCNNPNVVQYKDYGGRGISFCKEWSDDFKKFHAWATDHGYQEHLTLERIDVNGNYCPENCCWITMAEQALNRRGSIRRNVTVFGETKDIKEWIRDSRCKVGLNAFVYRLGAGWQPERALTTKSERA